MYTLSKIRKIRIRDGVFSLLLNNNQQPCVRTRMGGRVVLKKKSKMDDGDVC